MPTGGKICVQPLPYRPSRLFQVFSEDKADFNESIVVALSPHQYGRKWSRKAGWEHTGITFPHELQLFDRIIHEGSYQDEGFMGIQGIKYRVLDSWDAKGILDKPWVTGYEHPLTGQMLPDKHPLIGQA